MEAAVVAVAPDQALRKDFSQPVQQGADAHEIARFTEVMEAGRPHAANNVQVVHQTYATQNIDKPFISLGDTILNKLQQMGQGYQDRIRALEQRMNQPVTSPAEANKLFFEVSQISIQQQMALAVTSKVNKNAESLLRAQ
ncbi:hypothetical protein BTA51_14040 [Hahella sp. CCB-MM4]|uniref:hypothetical protein n=1 Tax=Hahella sp. (strain CCB-MM4) TaxID=1926491 RepID=UPI000B9A8C4B|nr:hypothetical protein [Hahella sp. CCB-MM4]OZG72646.1 hypothetical protein BTA51_14040 [Hahella sp. CCB-MM4]